MHNDDVAYTSNKDIKGVWERYSQSKRTLFLAFHAAQKNVMLVPIRKVSELGNSAHTVQNDEDATYTTNNDIQVAWEISPHLSANCYVRSHVTCDLKWKFNMSQRVTLFHLLNILPHNATTNITDE